MDFIDITSGMTSSSMYLAGNTMFVSSGGVAANTVMSNGGSMHVFNGGIGRENTVFEDGAIAVSSGGRSEDAYIAPGGFMQVESGGTAENTEVIYDAILGVAPGGVAKNTSLGVGGILGVSSGGKATGTNVDNGFFEIASGGSATSTNASGGVIFNMGGNAMLTTLDEGSQFFLDKGAFANITVVRGDSFMWVGKNSGAFNTTVEDGRLAVGKGGITSGTVVSSGGEAMVAEGASMESTTVKDGGRVVVWERSKLDSVTVESGGSVYAGAESMITGKIVLNENCNFYAEYGSVINFDLTDVGPDNEALLNDYSLVNGMPNYMITVTSDMADGEYVLADNVSSFNAAVYVELADNGELGFVTTGFDLYTWDKTYSLAVVDNSLVLTVDSTGHSWKDYCNGGAGTDVDCVTAPGSGGAFIPEETVDRIKDFLDNYFTAGSEAVPDVWEDGIGYYPESSPVLPEDVFHGFRDGFSVEACTGKGLGISVENPWKIQEDPGVCNSWGDLA